MRNIGTMHLRNLTMFLTPLPLHLWIMSVRKRSFYVFIWHVNWKLPLVKTGSPFTRKHYLRLKKLLNRFLRIKPIAVAVFAMHLFSKPCTLLQTQKHRMSGNA